MGGLLLDRAEVLRKNQVEAKQLDDIRLEFARVAQDFVFVMEEVKEELTKPVFCHSAAEVQWMQVSKFEPTRKSLHYVRYGT